MFPSLPERDLVTWNAMHSGFVQQGMGSKAGELLQLMTTPDKGTFESLLSACSRSGQVQEGREYSFRVMVEEYSITPSCEHHGCMVDMLGRAGCVEEAEQFMEPTPAVFGAGIVSQ